MNKNLCKCKFYKDCHEVRQKLQIDYRNNNKSKIEQCIFYKELEEIFKER